MPKLNLKQLGWSDFFANAFESYRQQGFNVGRVIIENRDCYSVLTEKGEINAEAAGRLLFTSDSPADLPKVGDWVVLQSFADGMAIIHDLLPRKTKFSRKVAGKKFDEQIMATNIDVIFIVQGLDNNFNPRRIERTLVMVNESGAKPIIILNKSDLCESTREKVEQTKEILKDIPILAVSAKENKGINELKSFLNEGETFAFIGSSGVGKSTLINKLVGQDILKTQDVRSGDSKGRHTTARRELIVLPDGGCLIDTPGMRELQLWHADEGLSDTFGDIDDLAENCHFSDCSHTKEIKCAVLSAIERGDLVQGRYDSYIKLQKELKFLASKNSKEGYVEHRKKDKKFGKMYKQIMKEKKNKKR